jgi:hypothetical protein
MHFACALHSVCVQFEDGLKAVRMRFAGGLSAVAENYGVFR